jgi:two-component system chemotaxis response regulator CheB
MGSDGLAGMRALKGKGAYSITQEADSCVVYGMPRAVAEAGLSDRELPIESIAAVVNKAAT